MRRARGRVVGNGVGVQLGRAIRRGACPAPPSRGAGPLPGSALPGHSAGFPVRLDLVELAAAFPKIDPGAYVTQVARNFGVKRLVCRLVPGSNVLPL
jgi:hypothetical protein